MDPGKPIKSAQNLQSNQSQEEPDTTQDSTTAPSFSGSTKEVPDLREGPDSTQNNRKSLMQSTIKQELEPVDGAGTSSRLKGETTMKKSSIETNDATVATTGVKEELPEPSLKSEPRDAGVPKPPVPSQTADKDSTISIVAVDSRPPLTIVQSFNDPIDGVSKGLSTLELKKESPATSVSADGGNVDKTEDASQCTEVSSSAS